MILIAGEEFERLNDIRERAKWILKYGRLSRSEIVGPDFDFMMELLKNHPDAANKIGPGVARIVVKEAPDENPGLTQCFWAIRVDGTEVDFSYNSCINLRLKG